MAFTPNELALRLAKAQAVLGVLKDLVVKLEQQLCELQCYDADEDDDDGLCEE